jgi:phosphoglycolate phosphatase
MPQIVVGGEKAEFLLAIFDLDGTLVNDEERYRNLAALRFKALAQLTDESSANEWARLGGFDPKVGSIRMNGPIAKASRPDDLAIAAAVVSMSGVPWYEAKVKAERSYSIADDEQLRNYRPSLFPGVEEKISEMKRRGFSLAIATNGPRKITDELLKLLNIDQYFSTVVGSEDVLESKPAPDMIFKVCEKCGIAVSDSAYIGDQPTDAEAGLRAGCSWVITIGDEPYLTGGKTRELVVNSVARFILP